MARDEPQDFLRDKYYDIIIVNDCVNICRDSKLPEYFQRNIATAYRRYGCGAQLIKLLDNKHVDGSVSIYEPLIHYPDNKAIIRTLQNLNVIYGGIRCLPHIHYLRQSCLLHDHSMQDIVDYINQLVKYRESDRNDIHHMLHILELLLDWSQLHEPAYRQYVVTIVQHVNVECNAVVRCYLNFLDYYLRRPYLYCYTGPDITLSMCEDGRDFTMLANSRQELYVNAWGVYIEHDDDEE